MDAYQSALSAQSIANKSIVVTGGASGIGEAAVRLFAAAGAMVTIADLSVDKGEALAKELMDKKQAVQFVRTDIASGDAVEAMVAAAVSVYGRLDGAFNNAGVMPAGKLLADLSEDDFRRLHNVNVVGTFLCLKHEIAAMLETGGGAIVNTASIHGFVYTPEASEYTASKHAVVGLTKAAAVDYARRGIRVNAIAPGGTRTPMHMDYTARNPEFGAKVDDLHAMGRSSEPVEQAQAAMWLLSDAASFVTGTTLLVDGGYTLL